MRKKELSLNKMVYMVGSFIILIVMIPLVKCCWEKLASQYGLLFYHGYL